MNIPLNLYYKYTLYLYISIPKFVDVLMKLKDFNGINFLKHVRKFVNSSDCEECKCAEILVAT